MEEVHKNCKIYKNNSKYKYLNKTYKQNYLKFYKHCLLIKRININN